MTYTEIMMLFVETSYFSRLISDYLSDDEYGKLQHYLMQHPESGKVISGSGGVRKFRWARAGMGKSGGVRIIYYWAKTRDQIYMLTIYSKSERENIDATTLARIAKSLETIQ